MLIWATILFILGILAFLDSFFTFGEIFRRANTFVLMLVSLGLLVALRNLRRVSNLKKEVSKA